jgi:hypothetical protein
MQAERREERRKKEAVVNNSKRKDTYFVYRSLFILAWIFRLSCLLLSLSSSLLVVVVLPLLLCRTYCFSTKSALANYIFYLLLLYNQSITRL